MQPQSWKLRCTAFQFIGGLSAWRTAISMGRETGARKNDGGKIKFMAGDQLQRSSEPSCRSCSAGGVNLAAAIHGALGPPVAQRCFRTLHIGCMMVVAHHVAVMHHVVLAVACGALPCAFASGCPDRRKPRANKGCNNRDGKYTPHFKTGL